MRGYPSSDCRPAAVADTRADRLYLRPDVGQVHQASGQVEDTEFVVGDSTCIKLSFLIT